MYMQICVCIYIYICVCVCVCIYIHTYYIYIYIYLFIYILYIIIYHLLCVCVWIFVWQLETTCATCISTTFQHLSPPLARRNMAVARFTLLNSPCLLHHATMTSEWLWLKIGSHFWGSIVVQFEPHLTNTLKTEYILYIYIYVNKQILIHIIKVTEAHSHQ